MMQWVLTPLFLILMVVNLVAAGFGLHYLVGTIITVLLLIVFAALRMGWWIAPAAFVGAWKVWGLAWYVALALAVPGLLLMLTVGSMMAGAQFFDRRARRERAAGQIIDQ